MWHKPSKKGELYIKAYELTKNIQLSEWKLSVYQKNWRYGGSGTIDVEDSKLSAIENYIKSHKI